VILVPGVAFTRAGARLGRGAGYYDRFLAGADPAAVKVGLAFSSQIVPELPEEPFDVRLDRLVTESAVIFCNPLQSCGK
jgi:5-formyltetrahydrofolate cyclo-ligase